MSMVVGVTVLAINPIILVVSRLGDERDRSIALLWLPCRLQPPTIPSIQGRYGGYSSYSTDG